MPTISIRERLFESLNRRAAEAVSRVPLPPADPVIGAAGPLFEHWRA